MCVRHHCCNLLPPQASQAELLELLAAAQHDAAASNERAHALEQARARVKELEGSIAAGQVAGEAGAVAASEMEFLRKERRAEVGQVDQEWRGRWETLQAQCAQLQTQVDAAAREAVRASEQHTKDVECVR